MKQRLVLLSTIHNEMNIIWLILLCMLSLFICMHKCMLVLYIGDYIIVLNIEYKLLHE